MRIEIVAGRATVVFAGTLGIFVPTLCSTHICCFHFFFEKVKGAQIFPAVILWTHDSLVQIESLFVPSYFFSAGKGVTGG